MKYDQGILTKIETGWVIKDNEGDLIPLDDVHYNPKSIAKSFIWNEARYNEGDIIRFNIYGKYVEPPADSGIHCNRGGTIPTARIVEDWDHILQGFTGGLKQDPATGNYTQLINFLKNKYDPPKRILDVKGNT